MKTSFRQRYESQFSDLVGAAGARAFALGRNALVILLKALGVKPGDHVGVCSFTCLSVIEAVKVVGAVPVYLDVGEDLCITPGQILNQPKNSLKVVVLQHTFGVPGQLDQLISACEKIGAEVIEDCAHSFGCFWNGKALGKFGAGAIYCSQWGKSYSTGQGGMLTVNSKELLEKVDRQIEEFAVPASKKNMLILEFQRRVYSVLGGVKLQTYLQYLYTKLRDIGIVKGSFELKCNFAFYKGYVRLADELTARAGLRQLEKWSKLQMIRRRNVKLIEKKLSENKLSPWPILKQADSTMLRYPVLTPHKKNILEKARKKKLDIAGWYNSPVHPLIAEDLQKVDYVEGSCPVAEQMISNLVHLPTSGWLNQKKLEDMMSILTQNN